MNSSKPLSQTVGSIRLSLSALYEQIANFDRQLASFGSSESSMMGEIHPQDISYARDWLKNYCDELEKDLQRFADRQD